MRLGACNALAAVSTVQEGRDAIRAAGGLRPLALLLAEGSRSATTAAAALTLMNCSACDTCKVGGWVGGPVGGGKGGGRQARMEAAGCDTCKVGLWVGVEWEGGAGTRSEDGGSSFGACKVGRWADGRRTGSGGG